MRGLVTCPSAKPISKSSRKRYMPCQIKRRWLSVEKVITTPCALNRLGLIFRNIFGGGSNSTGHLLELISRPAKLIAQTIRLQLHHFADVLGLHQLSRVFERGLQVCLGYREDRFCYIGHRPGATATDSLADSKNVETAFSAWSKLFLANSRTCGGISIVILGSVMAGSSG
jgi:hypothetical protein